MTDKRRWLEPGDLEEARDAEWRRSLTSYRDEDEIPPDAWRGGDVHPPATDTDGWIEWPGVERFCGPGVWLIRQDAERERDVKREQGT